MPQFVVDSGTYGPSKLSLSINEHSSRHSENFELFVTGDASSGICSRTGSIFEPLRVQQGTK
jgi:hypothetical protein